jgi:UDP-N-acetylmuramate dehydrogenase
MQGMVEGGVRERDPSGSPPSTTFGGPPPRAGEDLRGSLTANGSLADFIWFRTGGPAEWLVRPADVEDLADLLKTLDPSTPVLPVGVGSNLIVRDGGVPGVVVRLPKAMAKVLVQDGRVRAGAGAMGITVASAARDAGIAGLEFLRGIPGTVGGAVRMNAGAYGRDVSDILVEATVVTREGSVEVWPAARLGFTYRHSDLPAGAVVVEAVLSGTPGEPAVIGAEMDRIAAEREASQPLRSRTGGSTFKNPEGHKAWALIDAAGCRGLTRGDAQVSEKHCNFLLNLGSASSAEIEALGEEVRDRVKAHSGVTLEWEIQRVGISAPPARLREGAGGGPALSTSDAAGDGGRPPLGPLPHAGGEA